MKSGGKTKKWWPILVPFWPTYKSRRKIHSDSNNYETFSVKMFNAHISSSNANLELRDGTLKKWQQKIKISRRSRQPTSSESLASENPTQASEVKSHPDAV